MMELTLQIAGGVLLLASLSYASLVFLFFSGWKKLQRKDPAARPVHPFKVTVIVAVRNEEKDIPALLGDLSQQDYPVENMEVIISDDLSTDRTAILVNKYIGDNNLSNFKLIKREGNGQQGSKKAALVHAINASGGQILLTTDADCRLPKGWISALARHFCNDNTMLVGGPVAFIRAHGLFDRFQSMEFLGLVASGAGAAGAGQPFICNGASLAFRKTAFLNVKGFEGNEKYRSGDDVFLMHKIKKAYGRKSVVFALDREALVKTTGAENFITFLKQRARWASKSRGYRDFLSMFTAVTVFLLSLALSALFAAGFFHPASFLLFFGLILCKAAVDYPLLKEITGFTGDKDLIKWLLPFEAIYPFYVMIAGILSLFWRRFW